MATTPPPSLSSSVTLIKFAMGGGIPSTIWENWLALGPVIQSSSLVTITVKLMSSASRLRLSKILTGTYWMAKEEFEDISYKASAMLCKWREDIAEDMAQRAFTSVSPDRELVDLGNVVFYVGCEPLERALAKDYGAEWANRYKKAWVKHPA